MKLFDVRAAALLLLLTAASLWLTGCGCICGQKGVLKPVETTQSAPSPRGGPVAVLSPNSEAIWREGSVHTIRWKIETRAQVDSVRILLVEVIDPESDVRHIRRPDYVIATVPGNPGEWAWNNVGWSESGAGPYCGNYHIEIVGLSRAKIRLVDQSDKPLTIACPRNVSDPIKAR